jgi:uncharacterized protein
VPLFVYLGRDGDGAAERRPRHRPEHLAHLEPLDAAGRIHFAGPLLDAEGRPRGSVIVFEAEDLAAARAFAEADPYVRHGIFAELDVYESRRVFPAAARPR